MEYFQEKGRIMTQGSCREKLIPLNQESNVLPVILWESSTSGESFGHSGGDPCTTTNMYFQPNKGIGKILFANLSPYDDESVKPTVEIWNAMKYFEDSFN